MILKVLASASCGNMTLIKLNNKKIIAIDAGVSTKKIKLETNMADFGGLEQIDYLFISHGHNDHILGLESILSNYKVNSLYITQPTFRNVSPIIHNYQVNLEIIQANKEYNFPEFTLYTLDLNHDFPETLGFLIKTFDSKSILRSLVYITDTGFLDFDTIELIKDADIIMLEANYDQTIISTSPIDISIKRRIISPTGHLSNHSFCDILSKIIVRPCIVIAMHISSDRNNYLMINELFKKEIQTKYVATLLFSTKKKYSSLEAINL